MPLELGLLQRFLKSLNNRQVWFIDVAIHIVTVINIIIIIHIHSFYNCY